MHLCSSKTLETELYDYVTKSDLKEARIIWRYKGLPYAVEIQDEEAPLF